MTEAQAAATGWSPPQGTLGVLVSAAATRAAALGEHAIGLERAAATASQTPSFSAVLGGASVAVIAELKRRSPSRGDLNLGLDISARAAGYSAGGAAAISVLTEPLQFGGSMEDLRAARRAVALPLLRKDFVVDRLQLLEARAAGASAVLLIARAVRPAQCVHLAHDALELGLHVVLEVRTERELEMALGVDHAILGVNNRNLETLALDDAVSERLLPLVPAGRIAIYESGIRDRAGVERAAALGADAVLVGSTLSASADGEASVRALTGVPRRNRGG